MIRLHLRFLALTCVVACVAAAGVSMFAVPGRIATEDRNADGRPDVWHRDVARGEQTEVDIDSNFDGRPDIQEYYEHGALVRRESDRNFDDQVDLIEEFDAATQQHVRSVVDIDYDGTADLLVLFQDGHPVFAKYDAPSDRLSPAARTARFTPPVQRRRQRLLALVDPFRADASVRSTRCASAPAERGILSTSGGLPLPGIDATAPLGASGLVLPRFRPAVLADLAATSPRAPPAVPVAFFA